MPKIKAFPKVDETPNETVNETVNTIFGARKMTIKADTSNCTDLYKTFVCVVYNRSLWYL